MISENLVLMKCNKTPFRATPFIYSPAVSLNPAYIISSPSEIKLFAIWGHEPARLRASASWQLGDVARDSSSIPQPRDLWFRWRDDRNEGRRAGRTSPDCVGRSFSPHHLSSLEVLTCWEQEVFFWFYSLTVKRLAQFGVILSNNLTVNHIQSNCRIKFIL